MKVMRVRVTLITSVVGAALLFGCLPHVVPKQIPVTPQLVQQIGLPMYPHAKAISGQRFEHIGPSDKGLVIMLQTQDDPAKVESFYEQRMPSSTHKTSMSLGFTKPIILQNIGPQGMKQVTIMTMMGATVIQLQSISFAHTQPSP
jgi:hypothetical protein